MTPSSVMYVEFTILRIFMSFPTGLLGVAALRPTLIEDLVPRRIFAEREAFSR